MGRLFTHCSEKRSALWKGLGIGTGIGAAMMFLLDPQRGRRRRALVRDKIVRAARVTERAVQTRSRDWSNRTRGVVAQARGLFRRERVPDDVLEERVRAEIGHVIANPGSVNVRAHERRVTLAGVVFTDEVDRLISRVSSTRGVADVESRLEVHKRSDSSLQSSRVC